MIPATGYDIFGGDSDLSDIPLDDEWDIPPSPTRNKATKQKGSSNKPTARPATRNRSQSHGNLALTSTNRRPARSTRLKPLRSTYSASTSSTSGKSSPASSLSPLPVVTPATRKRKAPPSLVPIDTTPAKRQKKQERSLFDDLIGAMDKTTTPGKSTTTELPIGWTPCQSPSRQEEWSVRMLQDTKVFVKLLCTNGTPAASDAPFAEIYWWPARVSYTLLSLVFTSTLPQSNGPVTLNRATARLYGDDGYGRNRTVCLPTVLKTTVHTLRPSERNRLSRFTAHDFAQSPISSTLQESFRKALQEAMDDDGDDEPLDLDTIRARASQIREHSSSPVRMTTKEQNDKDDGHPWDPPPPPENLTIPGELVLCRHSRSERHTTVPFWPAKIVKYVPPNRRNGQAKYEVNFFDRETAKVSRDHFFTCFDEGFGSCTVCSSNKLSLWVAEQSRLDRSVEAPHMAYGEWSR
jgi:hypothetical protein